MFGYEIGKISSNININMINFDKFVEWAESRFDSVVVKGKEIRVNSIFADDNKHHMWCNPSGGKKDRPHGVYHCWKTENKGSLVSLVMMVDHITYDEALDFLEGRDISYAALEKSIDELYDGKKEEVSADIQNAKMSLPPSTYPLLALPENDYFRNTAEIYLGGRKIPTNGMMVCVGDELWYGISYRNRLIIPYYDKEGTLIYFNGRYLGQSKKILDEIKYLGPPKEIGIGKEDVIYMPHWPESGSKVYYTEGELDAKSIELSDLHAGAWGGKNVGSKQAAYMSAYKPVICLDNDKAGRNALPFIYDFLKLRGFGEIHYVRPPTRFKDWNDMLVASGPNILKAYLTQKEKILDASARLRMI